MNYYKVSLLLVVFFLSLFPLQNMLYKMQTHHKITEKDFVEDLIVHYFMQEKSSE